ncbi:MAG: peptidoglycan-binding protein [Chloroflexi bacterium]|nr:peptidoglycan-binding protein [Chloroflexota bacterium]
MVEKHRDLKIRMQGSDIKNLQDALAAIGFVIGDKAGYFGIETRRAIETVQKRLGLSDTGIVDADLFDRLANPSFVSGRVTQPNGNPIAGAQVRVIGKRLLAKDDTTLREIETDASGDYEVNYLPDQVTGSDLLVQILGQNDEVVASSPLIIEATNEQTVDLVVDHEAYRGLSEYERLLQRLKPCLNGTNPSDLDREGVAYLAGKCRVNPVYIAYLVQANRFAKATGIQPEAFYALLRANLPVSLPALVVQERATQQQALEDAVAANIINREMTDEIDNVLESLAAQRVEELLQDPELPVGSTSLGGLLKVAGIDSTQKHAFAEQFAATNGTSQAFWDELAEDSAFDDRATESVRLAIQLGALTQYNLALMKSLHQQLSGNGQDLRGLVGRNESEWLDEVRQHTNQNGNVMLPPDLPEVDGQSADETYARTMMRQVEATYPTLTIAAGIGQTDFTGANTVKAFLEQHDDLEFRDQNLRVYLEERSIPISDDVREQVFAFKRVFDLAPSVDRYKVMRPLLQDGLTSAYAIRKLGQRKFVDRYSQSLGASAAGRVYRAAAQKSAMASALLAANSPSINNLGMHVLPQGDLGTILKVGADNQETQDDIATWERLFGGVSFCTCEHCRSVYSPAAYLVDLLVFLEDQDEGSQSALKILFERRGDIGQIELNCHNTNTTLPYVDLVVEVLEHFLANEEANTGENWWDEDEVPQTEGEAEDLRVHPENIVSAAYQLLQVSDYPWTLPFNLWTAEMRSYLKPLGVTRAEILRQLNPHPANALPETLRNNVAAEVLHLIPRDWEILAGREAGGLGGWGGEPIAELRKVKTLMNKGRLIYTEVRRLLDTQYINGNGDLEIEFADDQCDIDGATIPALTEQPHADRIHRFMRLQRKLGWDFNELDAAIQVLGDQNLTDKLHDEFLRRLAMVKQLHDTLNTPILTLLSWWGNIDTTRRQKEEDEEGSSFYDRLFLNKSVGNQDDVEPFVLNSDRDELVNTSRTIEESRAAILAALNLITADELDLIIQKREVSDALNLVNLSELYRVATMAKALNLSVADMLYLIDLTDFDPFALANLEDLPAAFLDVLEIINASNFTIPELAYLIYHDFVPDSRFASGVQAIGTFLFKLRTGLKKLKQTYPLIEDPSEPGAMTVAPDPTGQRTRPLLAQLVPEEFLDPVMAVIAGTPDAQLPDGTQDPFDRSAIVDGHFDVFIDDLPAFKDKFINQGSSTYLDPVDALAERFHIVLEPLTNYLLNSNNIALVQHSFADFLDLDLRASDQLLGGLIKSVADAALPTSAIFLDDDFVDSDRDPLTETNFGNQYQMVRRLQKIALLLNKFDIPSDEVRWLAEESPQLGWLDFNTIPVSANNPTPMRFQAWLRMAQFAWLRRQIPVKEQSLFALLRTAHTGQDENNNAVGKDQFVTHLHIATGWYRTDIETLLDVNHFDLTFNNQFTGQQVLEHLMRLYHVTGLLQRLGVSAERAWTWAEPDVTREIASEVKQVARAKFGVEQWPSVAEPIRDDLRLQQRDALVDAALEIAHSEDIEEIADLYAYFLMDVEMDPCMLTSRIKQAISSVQLFVQRCLMNLEIPEVVLVPEAAAQWGWMKNYRVWEANRKIFLYPENYIQPELRPEKSPFFTDLENELLQNDVTVETVETAFLNYLEKLDEVARLEIASVYNDEEEAGTLHILGRTKSIPHKYFYRRWEKRRRWTPWESVPVDIEGDNVAVTRYNRRLYLFWFMTQEKADEETNQEIEVPKADLENEQKINAQQPKKYLEIKLAWSQYRSGKWSPKKLTESGVRTKARSGLIESKSYRPRPFPVTTQDGGLLIAVDHSFNSGSGNVGRWVDSTLDDHRVIEGDSNFLLTDHGRVTITNNPAPSQQPYGYPYYYARVQKSLAMRYRQQGYIRLISDLPDHPKIVVPLQYVAYSSRRPFFLEDGLRHYFIVPWTLFRTPDIHDWVTTSPVAVLANRIINLPDPTVLHPFAATLANEGIADPLPTLLPGLAGRGRSFAGIVSGMDTIRISPWVGDSLIARNVFGTTEASVGNVENENSFSTGATLLAGLLNTPNQPTPPSDTGTDTRPPFDLDSRSVDAADAVFESVDLWANIIQDRFQRYRFHIYSHPYVGYLIKQLNKYGIDGLLNPIAGGEANELRRQQKKERQSERFDEVYELSEAVDKSNLPVEEFDFTYTGAYALYNWELFFHAPLLIAARLSANQKFEAAQKWFHYMFDPTDASTFEEDADEAFRYWKIKPFFENRGLDNIRELLKLLSSNEPQDQAKREELEAQIADWRENPFEPHRIAEQRFVAYQKTTVMKYLDNLIAWGDYLFRHDTIESINEASQLYILCAQILGKRQVNLPAPQGDSTIDGNIVKNFDDLKLHLDKFRNALVQIENEISIAGDVPETLNDEPPTADILGMSLFFCTPRNDKLLRYWDTVADRLFKIRNCMNIEGVVRQLDLFQPPFNPELLMRATAAGIDIGSLLNDMKAPLLQYRYSLLVQKAVEFCIDVKQLGGALIAALEKRDAEELGLLRSSHEERLLKAIRDIRQLQLDDAKASLAGLDKNLAATQERQRFYAERVSRTPHEAAHLRLLEVATGLEIAAQLIALLKGPAGTTPQLNIGGAGFGGSPYLVESWGGLQLSNALDAPIQWATFGASVARNLASRSAIIGSHDRRQEEWDFQAGQAEIEIEALEKQIEGARLRIAIAENELENQELQIEQNREVDELMRMKFTNQELYSWMVTQISTIYFQSYQLAYDMAMRAQRAFQYELADYGASFVEFGYWDNLKKGLLAGDQLHYDLRRMESAYFEANRREYELTKHVSLLQLNPAALIQLRETGSCEIDIPEVIFDLDYPGHFLRRIKAVSLTIPCVTGPYTTVNCTLTLLNNRIRVSTERPGDSYSGINDDRYVSNVGGDQSIATSTAREDSGLFEFNFRDERYLPFEGAGAVGRWRLELPSDYRQFDYDSMADVVFHLRYTARDAGPSFKKAIEIQIDDAVNQFVGVLNQQGVFQLVSMKHEFGTEFHKFLNPVGTNAHQTTISLSKKIFPFLFQGRDIDIQNVIVFLKLRDKSLHNDGDPLALTISRAGFSEDQSLVIAGDELGGLAQATYVQLSGDITDDENWEFMITGLPAALRETVSIEGTSVERIKADEIEDFGILLQYGIS